MKIARIVLALALPWIASLAGAQEPQRPRPEPVPKEMIAGERLQPPGLGFSIQRPGEGWEWTHMGGLEEHNFQAINAAQGQIFMVLFTPTGPEPLSKEVAEGFLQGVRESAEAEGSKLTDVSLAPSQTPVPGSFRYSYGVHMEGALVYWTGYLVSASPKGFCVIQELRHSPGESEELTKFVRSFQIVQ